MNAKEKAQELLDKMSCQTYSFQEYAGAHYSTEEIGWEAGKKCAIICIENEYKSLINLINDLNFITNCQLTHNARIEILNNEKLRIIQEIEKL